MNMIDRLRTCVLIITILSYDTHRDMAFFSSKLTFNASILYMEMKLFLGVTNTLHQISIRNNN